MVEAENAPVAWLREILETAAEIELWAGRPEAALELVVRRPGRDRGHRRDGASARCWWRSGSVRSPTRPRSAATPGRAPGTTEPRQPCSTRLGRGARTVGRDGRAGDPVVDLLCHAEQTPARRASDPDAWRDVGDGLAGARPALPRGVRALAGGRGAAAAGVGAAAIAPLRAAHAAARELGAARLVEEAENLARWYRIDLLPDAPDRGSCRPRRTRSTATG